MGFQTNVIKWVDKNMPINKIQGSDGYKQYFPSPQGM